MKKVTLQIRFDKAWLLDHRNDFIFFPVAYLARGIASEFQFSAIRDEAASLECDCFVEGEEEAEKLCDRMRAFIAKAFSVKSLRGVAKIGYVLSETQGDEPAKEEKPDSAAEVNAFKEEMRDWRGTPAKREAIPQSLPNPSLAQFFIGDDKDEAPAEESVRPPQDGGDLSALLEKCFALREMLRRNVKGQSHAIEEFVSMLFGVESHKESPRRPRGLCLFAGPSGVGKTFLAELASNFLGLPFMRLDMSAFSDNDVSVGRFRGVNKTYRSAEEGVVTSFVRRNPRCLLLFEEIEKASTNVIQLFLQILEGGTCRDFYLDREISFSGAIIILTTNAGRALYAETGKKQLANVDKSVILEAIENDVNPMTKRACFPPELLSRFASGTVILFNHLDNAALHSIAESQLQACMEEFRSRFGIDVRCDKNVSKAILFGKGEAANARTLKGAAQEFFDHELMQLYGQMSLRGSTESIKTTTEVLVSVDPDGAADEVRSLFAHRDCLRILFFGDASALPDCGKQERISVFATADPVQAKSMLRGSIDLVLIDVRCNTRSRAYLPSDLEDIDSDGNDLFRYVCEYFGEMPVYLFDASAESELETLYASYISAGARGVLQYGGGDPAAFFADLDECCEIANTCKAVDRLTRTNRILTYNSVQILPESGNVAEIKLAGLCLRRNVSGSDMASVLEDSMRPTVHFSDVIGLSDAKESLREFINYLKNPAAFLDKGVRAPRGVLLYGPPGTGKTLLARAVAGESDVTFIHKNATEFFKPLQGTGVASVREVFRIARRYSPTVLFIDEIDAIGKFRTGSELMHGVEELQNAFLSELDGFVFDEKRPVFVLAATNFEIDERAAGGRRLLDPAFVRRFDRKIRIELPNTEERRQFIEYYLRKHGITHIGAETIANLALRSIGKSPADLENVIELGIRMTKGAPLTDAALLEALDVDRFGKEHVWDVETVRKTSVHEAGHTVVAWLTGGTPDYVTNISRGDHGGYVLTKVDDGKFDHTRRELEDKICSSLAGRAAEIVVYGEERGVTSGAESDLVAATDIASSIVCRYGMDGNTLLAFSEIPDGTHGDALLGRMNDILLEQMSRAVRLLRANRAALDALIELLMRKNSLTGAELERLFADYPKNV